MPSQLHLRDLINHLVIGVVAVLLFLLYFALYCPTQWRGFTEQWHTFHTEVGAPLLVPLILIICYVIGAALPSPRSRPSGSNDFRLRRFLPGKRECVSPHDHDHALAEQLFLEVAGKRFGVPPDDQSERKEQLLHLATASVLSGTTNLEQVDIERHIVLMYFDGKLCLLFFFATVASLIGAGWSLLAMTKPLGLQPRTVSWVGWALMTVTCYHLSRSCGHKAYRNRAYWRALVTRSFVVGEMNAIEKRSAAAG